MFQESELYPPEGPVTDLRTGQLNGNERARLQLVLGRLERTHRLAERRVDRYRQQLRRDLIEMEAHRAALRSHVFGFRQLCQLDDGSQRQMIKVFSQRGRYNYSLRSEVNFHRECMASYDGRLEHAKRLLAAARRQFLQAVARGDDAFPGLPGGAGAEKEAGREEDREGGGGELGPEFVRELTPPDFIFPRI